MVCYKMYWRWREETAQTWDTDGLSKEGMLELRFEQGKGAIIQRMWVNSIPSRKKQLSARREQLSKFKEQNEG